MKQATGNLWTYPSDAIVITTNGFVKANGQCVMGRGCAREARDRFPGIDTRLGSLIKAYGNRCFQLQRPTEGWPTIVTMPTKHVWVNNSDPILIETSARQLVQMADKFGWERIVMPRPGCGNGGLSWLNEVKGIIEPILDDRFTVITHR